MTRLDTRLNRPSGRSLVWIALLLVAVVAAGSAACSKKDPAGTRRIELGVLEDKIRGGWAGQMIGVSYGTPTEFRWLGKRLTEKIIWDTEMLQLALKQDDLYVDMTLAEVLDKKGLDATTEQFGEAFRQTKYHLWHANSSARRNLNNGIKAPDSGHPKYNAHANDIDFQIEADFIGLMTPGLPRESNKYCDRAGRVMNYGDGLYGGMFVCGMYSAAFFEGDPLQIAEAGLACIPADSIYGRLIRDTIDLWKKNPEDWTKTWEALNAKWDNRDFCPEGALRPFNIDASLNGAYIAIGLLYGGGDFGKSVEITTRCGQDSDCNPSSLAGILGVMLGFEKIPEYWKGRDFEKWTKTKFQHTDYTFDEICASTLDRALRVIQGTGGRVTKREAVIPPQTPQAPPLEQWDMGLPVKALATLDPAWLFSGAWQRRINSHHQFLGVQSTATGDEVLLKFRGSGIALIGETHEKGGRADVFINDKNMGILDAYNDGVTHDVALWHTYGLDAATTNTLRLVKRGDRNTKSGGTGLLIQGAVVYAAEKPGAAAGSAGEKPGP